MTPIDDNETLQIGPDPDKLFVYHRQQLSAMLDGELSPDEAKFMLRRLQHDTELAACWERWQVGGDVLRGLRNDLLPVDFAQRVALSLASTAAEPAAVAVAGGSRPRLARWGGGAAIAASVALLAVFATRQLPEPGAMPEPAAAAPLVAQSSSPAAVSAGPAPTAVDDALADAGERPDSPAPAPDPATALAATAVALAEVPRRAGERRNREQPPAIARVRQLRAPRDAQVQPAAVQAEMPAVAVAASTPPLLVELPDAVAAGADPFAMPATATARPWPRSLLPAAGTYTVAGGSLAPREPAFEPFRPGVAADGPWPVSGAGDQPAAATPPQP